MRALYNFEHREIPNVFPRACGDQAGPSFSFIFYLTGPQKKFQPSRECLLAAAGNGFIAFLAGFVFFLEVLLHFLLGFLIHRAGPASKERAPRPSLMEQDSAGRFYRANFCAQPFAIKKQQAKARPTWCKIIFEWRKLGDRAALKCNIDEE
jgi:hypothetical protein